MSQTVSASVEVEDEVAEHLDPDLGPHDLVDTGEITPTTNLELARRKARNEAYRKKIEERREQGWLQYNQDVKTVPASSLRGVDDEKGYYAYSEGSSFRAYGDTKTRALANLVEKLSNYIQEHL